MEANPLELLDPTSYRTVQPESPFQTEPVELGREQFLKLLVAQLENQDPLNPQQDSEFVAQLATFSSLEQLIDMNTRMDGMLAAQGQLVNSQALSLIGRDVIVASDGTFELGENGADRFIVDLAEGTSQAYVEISDSSGKVVRKMDLGALSAGRHTIEWDGTLDPAQGESAGAAAKPGTYSFSVRVSDGGELKRMPGMLLLPVEGVNIGEGGLFLVTGSRVIDFSRIVEIRTDGGAAPPPVTG